MKLRKTFWLGSSAILVLGLVAQAQDFGAAAGVAGGAGAAAPPPAGANLFSMLLPPPDMVERCRVKLCKCEIVKMLRSSLAPASLATGGLIPVGNCCPTIKREDLAKPADSSEGAAARIKKDLEEAAARRAAVRFLGTVDCRYWPEAEEALINALRADKIECVRYEAAVVLQRGCCCTKKVAKALTITIEGTETDGHPAERSCRVQDAAAIALSMCVFEDKSEKKEEAEDKKRQARVDPKDYYKNLDTAPNQSVYDNARKVLEKRTHVNSTQVLNQPHRAASQGLIGIFSHALESSSDTAQAIGAAREQQPTIVAVQPQQPQRRGLLYKLMPGSASDEPLVYNPPAPAPAPQLITTAPPVVIPPAAPPVKPVTTIAVPQRLPMANEIRQVGYVPTPAVGTMSEETPTYFSTAGSSSAAPVLRPTPPAPTTSSSNAPRSEGLGFVIINDSPARR